MRKRKQTKEVVDRKLQSASAIAIESLENRVLLHHGFGGLGFGGGGNGGGGFGPGLSTIEFSQAPAAVQTGLENLATADGLTPPTSTSTQTVFLGNRNGIETYTIDISGTGTQSALTVDQTGSPVTAPTNGTTTYGTLPPAVTTEASAIATALNLTVPASTGTVQVMTPTGGTSVYTIRLTAATTTTTTTTTTSTHVGGRTVSIDASGNPVGNVNLPFAAIPASIQTALNNNRPSAADALATTATQNVSIRTNSGITTYSTTFTTSGTSTTVTVDATGALAKLPSHSTTTFSALSQTVQNAINALASANGVTATIAGTQTVQVYDEANGTTIYSVTVNASRTGSSGTAFTYNLTVSVDQDGNSTTLPGDGGPFGGGPFGSSFGGFAGTSLFGGFGFFGRRRR